MSEFLNKFFRKKSQLNWFDRLARTEFIRQEIDDSREDTLELKTHVIMSQLNGQMATSLFNSEFSQHLNDDDFKKGCRALAELFLETDPKTPVTLPMKVYQSILTTIFETGELMSPQLVEAARVAISQKK